VNSKKANYWPHAIVLAIFGVFGLCVWTVKKAVDNPVQMDSFYFESYQDVDTDINKIMMSQMAFDKKYTLEVPRDNFKLGGENSVSIKLTNKESGDAVNDANISVVITRPATVEFDKNLKLQSSENGLYEFSKFDINRPGRWQIMSKVTVGGLTSFNKLEVNATK
jgi:hypothetical protein